MKQKFTLDQKDIEAAIKAYVLKEKGVEVKTVFLSYYKADSMDPRELSHHYAEVSE